MSSALRRLPVVAAPAYIEAIRRLTSPFTARLVSEPDNRFNRAAVAVFVGDEKVGYLPPELSYRYFSAAADAPVRECPGRTAPVSALEDTGVAIVLDLSACPPPDVE
jgi:hypothetical protein